MSTEKILIEKIENEIGYKEEKVIGDEISIENVSSEQVKFCLYELGTLLEEDDENNIYTACINAGFFNKNQAVLAIKYDKSRLVIKAFAKEGLLNQRTAEKAIQKLREKLKKNYSRPKKKKKVVVLCLLVGIFVSVLGYGIWNCKNMRTATIKYNKEITEYNKKVDEYNAVSKKVCVSNIEGFLNQLGQLPSVDEKIPSILKSWFKGNSVKKIENDIKTIKNMEKDLSEKEKIMKGIKNPSKEWVIKRIRDLSYVKDVKAVTKDNDVTGLLDQKNGGFKECIYFIYDGIENEQYTDEDDSISRGTDGGGAVEIFSSLEDAKERCNYLKEFDNTILDSGSYALIGTMVIRTSYKLSYEKQLYLTNKIFKAFTK